MILYLVAKIQYQAMPWREMIETETGGGCRALYPEYYQLWTFIWFRVESFEWIGIKVIKPKAKSFIVSTWYRPTRSNVDAMKDFKLLVQRIESLGLEVNILGDLNCNVAACPLESHTKNLLEINATFANTTSW